MKNFVALVFLVLIFLPRLSAQEAEKSIPQKPARKFLSGAIIQFDNRREEYFGQRGRLNGVKFGLEFYRRFRGGIAFYGNNNFYNVPYPIGEGSIRKSAKFNYHTWFAELVFFRNWRWELSATGAYGTGTILVNNYEKQNSQYAFTSQEQLKGIHVGDFSIHSVLNIFSWLGVGLGYGVRNTGATNAYYLDGYYRESYVDFRIKFSLGYLYKDIFKVEEIIAEKEYYAYRKKKRWDYVKGMLN